MTATVHSLAAYRERRGIRRAAVRLERAPRAELCACGKHPLDAHERVAIERDSDGKPTGRAWSIACWARTVLP